MALNKSSAFVVWFTGYSGAGKSTLAYSLKDRLAELKILCVVLDGDVLRSGINKDLGFSKSDRKENIRRTVEIAKMLTDMGIAVIVSVISPFEEDRVIAKTSLSSIDFFLFYVKCPLDVCKKRDVKGLYEKANAGYLKNFTGIDSVYEEPLSSHLCIETHKTPKDTCVDNIMKYLICNIKPFKNIHE